MIGIPELGWRNGEFFHEAKFSIFLNLVKVVVNKRRMHVVDVNVLRPMIVKLMHILIHKPLNGVIHIGRIAIIAVMNTNSKQGKGRRVIGSAHCPTLFCAFNLAQLLHPLVQLFAVLVLDRV